MLPALQRYFPPSIVINLNKYINFKTSKSLARKIFSQNEMGILPLKKHVNRDKCSFNTKQRIFGVFAIDEILRYR